ncbi:unnamed protein product [Urochloa decumbens]|uniref:F-box domain-containing protein n=1 Tax=Urochloa decumbens TaxID=240449 RepID=A0ABC8VYX0_9POAL
MFLQRRAAGRGMRSSMAGRIAAAALAAQPALPDDILEDIFLLLDDAADLVIAAASCTSFRRIVSDRRFRRHYRSLHRPPVLGFLDCARRRGKDRISVHFYPVEPPHSSAPAARAVVRDADFTLPFLSDPSSWRVSDVRDGRILLSRQTTVRDILKELIVCDPLHRRHIQIPLIPHDLIPYEAMRHFMGFEPFLDPATEKEKETEDEDLPFRVICNVFSDNTIHTFVFSSGTGEWRLVASFDIRTLVWLKYPMLLRRHYACNCFYWTMYARKVMLVLETREMKFSTVALPPESKYRENALVEVGEGKLGLLILGERMLFVYSRTSPNNRHGIEDWRYDNAIPLVDRRWSFGGGAEGYALLEGVARNPYQILGKKTDTQYFTVELKTLSVKRLCATKSDTASPDYLYASFPLPLSLPSL